MNDIDLITGLRPEEPLATPDDLAVARVRLHTALAAEPAHTAGRDGRVAGQTTAWPGASPVPGLTVRRASGRARLPGRGARRTALAGAAVAAAGLVAVAALANAGGRPPGPVTGARGPAAEQGGTAPVTLTAAQFLTTAADSTQRQPAKVPRPDQFVYADVESLSGPGVRPQITQTWISVDGARQGLIEPAPPAPPGAWKSRPLAQQQATGCVSQAAFPSNLPTDPRMLLAYLGGDDAVPPSGIPDWTANVVGKHVWGLATDYLLPAQRAAVFRLIAQIPGLHLAPHVVDPAGRTGWASPGSTRAARPC